MGVTVPVMSAVITNVVFYFRNIIKLIFPLIQALLLGIPVKEAWPLYVSDPVEKVWSFCLSVAVKINMIAVFFSNQESMETMCVSWVRSFFG